MWQLIGFIILFLCLNSLAKQIKEIKVYRCECGQKQIASAPLVELGPETDGGSVK